MFVHVLAAHAKLRPLSPQDGSPKKAREDFLTEATIMGQFDDSNVIYLHGVVSKCEWAGLVGGACGRDLQHQCASYSPFAGP